MKITEFQGDVFTLLGDEIYSFAHGCNTKGSMGAGVAKPVKDRWPEVYRPYKKACDEGRFKPGLVQRILTEDGIIVYNLASQEWPGRDAKLEWVVQTVTKMVIDAHELQLEKIATVRIGCGIGGLDWAEVKPALEAIESPIELVVAFNG